MKKKTNGFIINKKGSSPISREASMTESAIEEGIQYGMELRECDKARNAVEK